MRRGRALAALAHRWDVPVTTVVAAGGFGKSTLLRQAVDEEGSPGVDVLLTCRPFDSHPAALAQRLTDALGSSAPLPSDDPVDLAGVVVGTLAARSPHPIALLLDDVHELGDATPGIELLRVLLRTLPANAHVVLSGRRLASGLGLTRFLAADGLVRLGPEDLRFDDRELETLAEDGGLDPADLQEMGGWPALVRLSMTTGRRASLDYLREEVLSELDAPTRTALAAAVISGGPDGALLAAVGVDLTVGDLVRAVPLVDRDGDRAVPHATWSDILDQIVDPAERARLAVASGLWLSAQDEHDRAITLLSSEGRWGEVDQAVLAALRGGNALASIRRVRAWLDQIPVGEQGRPGVKVARGLVARLERGPPHGDDLVASAESELLAAGDADGGAVALIERFWKAWNECDAAALEEMRARADRLEQLRPGCTGAYAAVFAAACPSVTGDAAGALRLLDARVDPTRATPAARAFLGMWRAMLLVHTGQADLGLDCSTAAREAAAGVSGISTDLHHVMVSWFAGDPAPSMRYETVAELHPRSARDHFIVEAYVAIMSASFGDAVPVDVERLRAAGMGHARDDAYAALAGATSAFAAGAEDVARRHLRELCERHGHDDPLLTEALTLHLAPTYVLLPELRPWLDSLDLGPTLRVPRALAQALVEVREGRTSSAAAALPQPPQVLTALPLPWAIELALAADAAGRDSGVALTEYLLDVAAAPTRAELRRRADDGEGEATALLAAVPSPPSTSVTVRVLGPLEVDRGPAHSDARELSRRRVRQLLALLVVRRRIGREAAMAALWPDLDPTKARNNLNVTVGHLRSLLEPGRLKGEASYAVRIRGDALVLQAGDHLAVDLWQAEADVDLARRHEAAGRMAEALEAYAVVAERWRGEPLVELVDLEDCDAERQAVTRILIEATCRAGELAMALREPGRALQLVERVLAHDPLIERAHRLVVAASLAGGDRGSAQRAFGRAESALAQAGLTLSDETQVLARQLCP
ncbi:hypothetical protein BH24ACT4_BH24ACT4_17650 [soil metagenome]